MSFSNRRNSNEGRGVEGKYIPCGVIGEVFVAGYISCCQTVQKHRLDIILSSTTNRQEQTSLFLCLISTQAKNKEIADKKWK